MTNYEKIKAMSVEEMAEFFSIGMKCYVCPASMGCFEDDYGGCSDHLVSYLKQEAEK